MYLNNIHILVYILFGIIGAGIGFMTGWANVRLPEYKKIFSKEIVNEYKTKLKPNYVLIIITAIMYMALLYINGLKKRKKETISPDI